MNPVLTEYWPLGLFLLETIGSRAAFLVSSVLFAVSAWLMWRLHRRMAQRAARATA